MKKVLKTAALIAAIMLVFHGCYRIKIPDNGQTGTSQSSTSEYSSTSQSTYSTSSVRSEESAADTTKPTSSTTEASSSTQQSSTGTTSQTHSTTTAAAATTKATTTQKKTEPTTKATAAQSVSSPTYINGILIANKTYALPKNYNPGEDSKARNAFNRMAADAAAQGINLHIVSGFRSYSSQESIYNNYVARDGKAAADRYSARPGHSEHQTGLAFDVNSLSQSFENTKEGKWLAENCHNYGFIIRYPKGKESITGYMYEPWHIRYLGTDTAASVYYSGLTLEEYLGINSVYQ